MKDIDDTKCFLFAWHSDGPGRTRVQSSKFHMVPGAIIEHRATSNSCVGQKPTKQNIPFYCFYGSHFHKVLSTVMNQHY